MRNPSKNTAYIEVPVCEGYSIGYGPWAAVWASGRAGWYEINPSEEYKLMHEYMCEGITLYYKIMDEYEFITENVPKRSKKKRKLLQTTPLDKVLFKVGSRKLLFFPVS